MKRSFLLALLLFPLLGFAAIDAYQFSDPEKEARFKVLIAELRCLVCQNQNLADSNAELAQDMRKLTYEMVQRGDSNEKVVAFMVDRYGDFVMYRPPMRSSTFLLWVGPFIILAVGVFFLVKIVRGRGREQVEELSTADRERAERLLNQSKK
ncbi:MAG: cytochrome c-type biogenesis protein [Candidatus Sedimenticola sp. (ex Thyasira tokunagai)]